jgi:hypothetical protein
LGRASTAAKKKGWRIAVPALSKSVGAATDAHVNQSDYFPVQTGLPFDITDVAQVFSTSFTTFAGSGT